MEELIPIREAARRLGVSDTAVHKAIKTGRVTVAGKNPSNGRPLLSWPSVMHQWSENSDTSKRSHVGAKGAAGKQDGQVVKLPTSDDMDAGLQVLKPEALPAAPRKRAAKAEATPPNTGDTAAAGGEGDGDDAANKPARDAKYNKSRADREFYNAELARLEYEEKIGKLVDADEVAARWSKLITAAKTRILGIPAECKSRQADLPLTVIAVIDNVCREVLEDLANGRD